MRRTDSLQGYRLVLTIIVCGLTVAGLILLVNACRSCNPPKDPILTFHELDSAYCELVDIRGRAQREFRRDPHVSYLEVGSFTNAYPDKCLGYAMHNQYAIVADFSKRAGVHNPVPPLLSFPRELMRQFPFRVFPVFLMRPQDNDFQQVTHLVRVAFLKKQDIDSMVLDKSFTLEHLEHQSALPAKGEHPVWMLYSQEHIFDYLKAHESR